MLLLTGGLPPSLSSVFGEFVVEGVGQDGTPLKKQVFLHFGFDLFLLSQGLFLLGCFLLYLWLILQVWAYSF